MNDQECTDFIAQVPTVFDETIALDGKVGEFSVIARKKNDIWYIGAMNNWTEREITLDLSVLGEGSYDIEWFKDGINADKQATDYKRERRSIYLKDKLTIHMAPGGGWAASLRKL
jgi:alpha-glucosidase